jgi:hypothetical protein
MKTIRVQNIPLSVSIDDLVGHFTMDRTQVAYSSLECSHDNPSTQVATITFKKKRIFKTALLNDKTILRTASDSVEIDVDDHFDGLTVVAGKSSTDVEYGCFTSYLSKANELQYHRISRTKWTRISNVENEAS